MQIVYFKFELPSFTFEPRHVKTCLMTYANYKGADQPAHPRSLISTFLFAALSKIPTLAKSRISMM